MNIWNNRSLLKQILFIVVVWECGSSTLDKLLFGVFTQLNSWKKQLELILWDKYPITSNSCTH